VVILTRPLPLRECTGQRSALGHDAEHYRERAIKIDVARCRAAFDLGNSGMDRNEPFVGCGGVAAYRRERRMRLRQRAELRGNNPIGGGEAGVTHAQFAHSDAPQRRVALRLASICAAVKGAACGPTWAASARMVRRDFADSHAERGP
jgi:hypothetical protein